MKEKWNGDALKWFRFLGFVDPAFLFFFPFLFFWRDRDVCIGHKMKCHFNDVLLASIDKFTFTIIIYPCTEQFIIDFPLSFKYNIIENALFVVLSLFVSFFLYFFFIAYTQIYTLQFGVVFLTFISHFKCVWKFVLC